MNFHETTQFLYSQVPVFQHSGANAYKPGLYNTNKLDKYFNHPHTNYKTIHVGGTNGKGSCSHTLAAILQQAGYKVGLYTSPHLVDFRERIRVNGEMITEQYVVDFVANHFDNVKHIMPSFFELTMMMAFCYFREQNIDIAIIEVGLGGRLDSTNVISPELSIITNISYDHVQFLGDTLDKIAYEKAGIIKRGIPCVVGETNDETRTVFIEAASNINAPLYLAQESNIINSASQEEDGFWHVNTNEYPSLPCELGGDCQIYNIRTILTSIPLLIKRGFNIPDQAVYSGFRNVCELTGLQGRWQKINNSPIAYCDTGHNIGGITYIVNQLKRQKYDTLRIVIGMVNDKDINKVLSVLPKDAVYYFTKASVSRALDENEFMIRANEYNLHGKSYATVTEAYNQAMTEADKTDFIFVGGSNFIVADLLSDKLH